MNGSKAKQIRKEIYGDNSLKPIRYSRLQNGQVVCLGRRSLYQVTKRLWQKKEI
jgi:hypothetical protein